MPSGEKMKLRYMGFSGKILAFYQYFFYLHDFLSGFDLFYVIWGDKSDFEEKSDKISK